MTREIRPLQAGDLDALSRFLTAGFRTAADADFAAPEVLAWKYLEPLGEEIDPAPRSYVAHDDAGALIGHVGLCRTEFRGHPLPGSPVSTLHMIDWLGSPGHPSVGASLMRRAHEQTSTQFGLGGSNAGRAVIKRGGYEPRQPVPVFQRVLRPGHRLRVPGQSLWRRGSLLVRDAGHGLSLAIRPRRPGLQLRPVTQFGEEVEAIAREAEGSAILTRRTAARLNHLLRFPRQAVTGWHLVAPPDRLVGFAVLNLVPQHDGRVRLGKVVDCLLGDADRSLWAAAIVALTGELARQRADVAQGFAGTPRLAEGFRDAGYTSRFELEFSLRDRRGLIPPGAVFHLMPIEADYAYT
ncbi:MAG: acetyltransferase [Isosphaeraceae bacterium]